MEMSTEMGIYNEKVTRRVIRNALDCKEQRKLYMSLRINTNIPYACTDVFTREMLFQEYLFPC
jgi:hypothetical protein